MHLGLFVSTLKVVKVTEMVADMYIHVHVVASDIVLDTKQIVLIIINQVPAASSPTGIYTVQVQPLLV